MLSRVILLVFVVQACATTSPSAASAPNVPASGASTCRAFAARWPETIGQIEAVLRLRDEAQCMRSAAAMRQYLDGLNLQACPEWTDAVAMQRALVDEFASIFKTTHDADNGEASNQHQVAQERLDALRAQYIALHDHACVAASGASSHAWHIYKSEPSHMTTALRAQRYVINMETDASLVGHDGTCATAASDPQEFVALAQTPVRGAAEGRMYALQGQGPITPRAADMYVQHSLAYAKQKHVGHVVFVNAAGGQIPNFSAALRHNSDGAATSYVEFTGWTDGSLVTPKIAAQYVVSLMPYFADAQHPTLMVVNCNAGLDRSGTLNTLVRLAIEAQSGKAQHLSEAQLREQGFARIPQIVAQLKTARPHSISTFGRYMFLYQSFDAYVDILMSQNSSGGAQ